MNVGGFEFEHISEIEPIRDVNGVLKEFLPQGRYRNLRGCLSISTAPGRFVNSRFQIIFAPAVFTC